LHLASGKGETVGRNFECVYAVFSFTHWEVKKLKQLAWADCSLAPVHFRRLQRKLNRIQRQKMTTTTTTTAENNQKENSHQFKCAFGLESIERLPSGR